MRKLRYLVLLPFILLNVSCVRQMVNEEDAKGVVDHYLSLLVAGDYDAVVADASDVVRAQITPDYIGLFRELCLKGAPIDRRMISGNVTTYAGRSQWTFLIEYRYPGDVWCVVNCTYTREGERIILEGFGIRRVRAPLEELNAFHLDHAGAIQIVMGVLTVCVPLFILVSLIYCIRTPMRRKWLWLLFIAVGLGQNRFYWMSGALVFNPIGFQVLGSGAMWTPLDGQVLMVSLPLGAILFWFKRRKVLRAKASPADATSLAPAEQAPESPPPLQ